MTLDELRDLCMSLPGATEGIKWEDHICFMVGGKMFCITGEQGGASLKVTPDEFDELTEREGIIPQAYMAHNKWVRIEAFHLLKRKEWEHFVKHSYMLIAAKLSKKMRDSFQN